MCECFENSIERVRNHLQENGKIPDGVDDFEIDWQGRSFILSAGEYAPTNPKIEYSFTPIKKDGSKAKNKKKSDITLVASHCCFCGEKFDRPEKATT